MGRGEAHCERAGRPKVRHARRRRRGRRSRGDAGERGHGRLRQRDAGRRVAGAGGGRERVAAAVGRLELAVGPPAVRLDLPLAPRPVGQPEAQDEAHDDERRREAQEDLGRLPHVAAHCKAKLVVFFFFLLSGELVRPPLSHPQFTKSMRCNAAAALAAESTRGEENEAGERESNGERDPAPTPTRLAFLAVVLAVGFALVRGFT
uniref:Uncharacterized protein n=1 Tax=Oryza barthii TaxID=65489 RepID=A0A0D3G0Q4_9ORYZ